MQELEEYLRRANVEAAGLISLPDARLVNFNPEVFAAKLAAPERFYLFASLDHSGRLNPGLGPTPPALGAQVEELAGLGADGIKMWLGKPSFQAAVGLRLDSPEVAGVYAAAAGAALPVLVHVADPQLFWRSSGSRFGWSGEGSTVPAFDELQRQAEAVLEANPGTTFIFPHLLFRTSDLSSFTSFMRRYPNATLDLSPGVYFYAELHRDRAAAQDFFDEFRLRILFGSDGMWFEPGHPYLPSISVEENLRKTSRLLEFLVTDNEIENPFEFSREELPSVRGLALSSPIVSLLTGENFRRLMTPSPRTCNADQVAAYAAGIQFRRHAIARGGENT